MSRSLEEVIRIKLESAGVENVDALVKAFSELEQSGELTQAELSGLVDKLIAVTDAAGDIKGIEAAIDSYRTLGEQQAQLRTEVERTGLALELAAQQERGAAEAYAQTKSATADARQALEEYRKSADRTREGLDAHRAAVRAAVQAEREAKTAYNDSARALAQAFSAFDGVDNTLASVNRRLGEAGKVITDARLSTDDLAKAQAELATRSEAAGDSVAAMVRDAEQAAEANRELARATAEAAAAAVKAEKDFEEAFRSLGGAGALRDTTAEIQRLEAAYETLARSGKLSTEQLSRAQEELQKRLEKLREGTAEYRAEQERAAQAQAQAAAFAEELAQETARAQAEADDFAKALKRQADAADKAAQENAELNREGERGSAIFSKLKGVLAGVAAAFSFTKVAGAIKDVFTQASAAEQATAQLEASLASTGNAAGLTAQELRAMADEMRSVTNFTDEQIQSAQTRLLSYTDIAKNEFPAALQIVLDQSARLGMSVEQSAEIVGRALQSPSKAMQSLSDQGFKFTAQQKEMLKSLEATGRMAEAQAVIMEMLAESYGGAALAQRVGMLSGAFKGLGDAVEDVQKRLVDQSLMNALRDEINATSSTLNELANSPQFAHLKDSFDYAFRAGLESVKTFREGASLPSLAAELGDVARTLGDVITIVNAAGERTQFFSYAWDGFRKTIVGGDNELMNLARHGLSLVAHHLREVNEELPAAGENAERAASGMGVMAAAARALYDGLDRVRGLAIDGGISAAAVAIADKLRDAADSAAAARTEVAGLVAGISDMSPGEIGNVAMGIAQVASESERAGRNVRDGLVASLKSLTGEQLLAFAQASQQAFDTFNTGAEKAAVVSQTVLLTALERLGVKGAELGVAITDSGRDIIATLRTVAESAEASAEQIEAAFKAAVGSLETKQELAALEDGLRKAFEAGRVSAEAMSRVTDELNAKMRELEAAANPLNDAFERLGITSQEALQAAADSARDAFDQIVEGSRRGEASMADVRRAFEAYARTQLDAARDLDASSRQQVEAMLRQKAATLGLLDVVEDLGITGVAAGDETAAAMHGAADAIERMGGAADAASTSLSGVGSAATSASVALGKAAAAASNYLAPVQGMSIAFDDMSEAMQRVFSGIEGGLLENSQEAFARWGEESAEVDRLTESLQEQNLALDETGRRLLALREQYTHLSDARLRLLAQEQLRAEKAAEGAERDKVAAAQQRADLSANNDLLRERNALLDRQAQQTQQQAVTRVVEVRFTQGVMKVEFDVTRLSQSDKRALAQIVIDEIGKDRP